MRRDRCYRLGRLRLRRGRCFHVSISRRNVFVGKGRGSARLKERINAPIYDHEAGNIRRLIQDTVQARHEEADATLQKDEDIQSAPRTDPVADVCAGYGAGEVEGVDQGAPAEALP